MTHDIGVETVVYQDFSVPEIISELRKTTIDSVELSDIHVSPESSDETIERTKDQLADAAIDVCGYGVPDLLRPADVEPSLALTDRLGGEYVAANFPPLRPDVVEELLVQAKAYDLVVNVHNYSTVHFDTTENVFATATEVRELIDEHDDQRLRACVDLGHFLVMNESPAEVVRELGTRIHSVHLKDTSENQIEDAPGQGVLDLAEVVDLLETHTTLETPLVIEYELPADRATEALINTEHELRAALNR